MKNVKFQNDFDNNLRKIEKLQSTIFNIAPILAVLFTTLGIGTTVFVLYLLYILVMFITNGGLA